MIWTVFKSVLLKNIYNNNNNCSKTRKYSQRVNQFTLYKKKVEGPERALWKDVHVFKKKDIVPITYLLGQGGWGRDFSHGGYFPFPTTPPI